MINFRNKGYYIGIFIPFLLLNVAIESSSLLSFVCGRVSWFLKDKATIINNYAKPAHILFAAAVGLACYRFYRIKRRKWSVEKKLKELISLITFTDSVGQSNENIKVFNSLIDYAIKISFPDRDDCPDLLHWVFANISPSTQDSLKLMSLVVEHPLININSQDSKGRSVLHKICMNEDDYHIKTEQERLNCLRLFFRCRNLDTHIPDMHGYIPLDYLRKSQNPISVPVVELFDNYEKARDIESDPNDSDLKSYYYRKEKYTKKIKKNSSFGIE